MRPDRLVSPSLVPPPTPTPGPDQVVVTVLLVSLSLVAAFLLPNIDQLFGLLGGTTARPKCPGFEAAHAAHTTAPEARPPRSRRAPPFPLGLGRAPSLPKPRPRWRSRARTKVADPTACARAGTTAVVISFVAPALFWETFVGYMYPWHHPRKLFCQARVLRSSAPSPSPSPTQTQTQKI